MASLKTINECWSSMRWVARFRWRPIRTVRPSCCLRKGLVRRRLRGHRGTSRFPGLGVTYAFWVFGGEGLWEVVEVPDSHVLVFGAGEAKIFGADFDVIGLSGMSLLRGQQLTALPDIKKMQISRWGDICNLRLIVDVPAGTEYPNFYLSTSSP